MRPPLPCLAARADRFLINQTIPGALEEPEGSSSWRVIEAEVAGVKRGGCSRLVVLYLLWYTIGMADQTKPIPIHFWRSRAGNEPGRDWLRDLGPDDQRVIGRDIAKVQFGWPIGLPVCRSLGDSLWEVRSTLPSKREARVIFAFHEGVLVALHAFIKKSQRTPGEELTLARQRLKDLLS